MVHDKHHHSKGGDQIKVENDPNDVFRECNETIVVKVNISE